MTQKISAVRDWPVPADKPQMCGFPGLASYYCRFVARFATIAAPLHRLLKKELFNWTEACETAFDSLREVLAQAPVLLPPDPTYPFLLDANASNEGIGVVLSQ